MEVLDRVFDGDDVLLLRAVDLADEGSKSGALSRAGRSADQDQSSPRHDEIRERRWKMDVLERGNARGECAQRRGQLTSLLVQVDPEACCLRNTRGGSERQGKIRCTAGPQLFVDPFAPEGCEHHLQRFRLYRLAGKRDDFPVDPAGRWCAGDEDQVAGVMLQHLADQASQRRPRFDLPPVMGGFLCFRFPAIEVMDQTIKVGIADEFWHGRIVLDWEEGGGHRQQANRQQATGNRQQKRFMRAFLCCLSPVSRS